MKQYTVPTQTLEKLTKYLLLIVTENIIDKGQNVTMY